jgi:hypothetical protein
MNRSHLRAIAAYYTTRDYIQQRSSRQRVNDANPALLATLATRDPNTGETLAATPTGGTVRLGDISTGGYPAGVVIPAAVATSRCGFADWKPGS